MRLSWVVAGHNWRVMRGMKPKGIRVVKLCALVALLTVALSFPLVQESAPATASAPPSAEAHLIFMGDIMLGRYVNSLARGNFDAPFASIGSYVTSADLAIANMEGPLVPLSQFS